ncbi:MAG TPA: hypothetical protein VNR87_13505 [Flavisolibacter sp.]|nr:hypothetical protein [Flavisolibacter sp.]
MTKAPQLLLKVLTNSFILSVIFLLISIISREDSLAETVFGFIGLFGIIVTSWIFIVHAFSIIIRFLLKEK